MDNIAYLKRKPTRLKNYDYSSYGAYFITICTHGRKKILSEIVGCGVYDAPKIKLHRYGKVAEKYITYMNERYNNISIDKYIIMPNHIHMIIVVQNTDNNCSSQAPNPTNETIPKFISLFKRYCNREYGQNIWQRSFHDHIIRDKNDYEKIWKYIEFNHLKWSDNCHFEE